MGSCLSESAQLRSHSAQIHLHSPVAATLTEAATLRGRAVEQI